MPKLETLVDTFDTTVDKATKWVDSSAAVVWDASARAKIPCTTSYWDMSTTSTGGYDLTGSYLLAKVTPAVGGAGSRETFMEVTRAGVTTDKYMMFVSGTDLVGRRVVGGATSGSTSAGAYNATNHAWWRIREAGGTVYFGYSANGTSWTEFTNFATGFAITSMWVSFSSGYWGTESAADTFVDSVNSPPGSTNARVFGLQADVAMVPSTNKLLVSGLQADVAMTPPGNVMRVSGLQLDVAWTAATGMAVTYWNGAAELPATLGFWNGAAELPATVSEIVA